MDSHEAGRGKDAWRERNAGKKAPGDGQNKPVKNPYDADQRDPHEGSTDVYADTSKKGDKKSKKVDGGLTTKNSPGLLGRRKG